MTRNEAKEFDIFSYNGDMDYVTESAVSSRIESIFDYFENRSCDNCKCFHQEYLCLEIGNGTFKPKEIGLKYCDNWSQK